jgi:hypothetical protein
MVSLADIQINRGYEADDSAGEDLSYLSMESLFTPPGIGLDERRMQVRAYNHWLAMVEDSELPAVEELRPETIADFGPNGVLVDLTLGIDRPAIVYLGERLSEECGADREIFDLGDVPERSLLSRLTEHCLEVVATRSPVGFDAEFEGRAGKTIYYRSILLPFSSNGSSVDFVFGVISWKEGAVPTAPQVPVALLEAARPAAVAEAPGLGDLLTQARQAAHHAAASESRSHEALYHVISVSYDLLQVAEVDPAGFARLAEGSKFRDPVRTVVRLVFGPHHDKTRLSEIVTVLTLAKRQELPRGGVYAWLAATPGGIKALVAQARLMRRGTTSAPGRRRLSASTAANLRRITPLAADDAVSVGREFGLLVARRNRDGSLALIGDAGGDVRLLERAAKRLLIG